MTQCGHLTVHTLLNNQLRDRIAGGIVNTVITMTYIMRANKNENNNTICSYFLAEETQ